MKYVVSLTIIFVLLVSSFTIDVLNVPKAWRYSIDSFGQLNYKKELRISGLDLLSETEVKGQLPTSDSNLWWYLSPKTIVSKLVQHPLIASVDIARCQGVRWACFALEVEERTVELIVLAEKDAWYVGHDGGFISPLSKTETEQLAEVDSCRYGYKCPALNKLKVPLVQGAGLEDRSPNLVVGRHIVFDKLVETLADKTKLKVSYMKILPSKEVVLRFVQRDFAVVLALDPEGGQKAVFASINEQTERLAKLLAEISHQGIAKIDLAYNMIAVVQLVDK